VHGCLTFVIFFITIISIIYFLIHLYVYRGETTPLSPLVSLPPPINLYVIPIYVLLFSTQPLFPVIDKPNSKKKQVQNFMELVLPSVIIVGISYLIIGVFGYLAFGEEVRPNVYLSYTSAIPIYAIILFATLTIPFHIILTQNFLKNLVWHIFTKKPLPPSALCLHYNQLQEQGGICKWLCVAEFQMDCFWTFILVFFISSFSFMVALFF